MYYDCINLCAVNLFASDLEESHYWSEFGLMNGGKVETKKEVLDKRAARFNSDKGI